MGAYHAHGAAPVANDPTAAGTVVPAVWALDAPTVEPITTCLALTRKGKPCNMKPAVDESNGGRTQLCIGHWNAVLAYQRHLEGEPHPSPQAGRPVESDDDDPYDPDAPSQGIDGPGEPF